MPEDHNLIEPAAALATTRSFADHAGDEQTVQVLAKAFAVLELMSARGVAEVAHLSQHLDLPKPTVVRLLHSLVACGYVRQVYPRRGYVLTSKLMKVGSGFEGLAAFLEAGLRTADDLTADILWPVSLAAYESCSVVVRYSTIPASPHSHVRSTIGKRLPLATSGHGKAWLAFTAADHRAEILDACGLQDAVSEEQLAAIREQGYATRTPGRDPSTNTIAAPVLRGSHLVGTIGVTFFARVVPESQYAALGRRMAQAGQAVAQNLPLL